jgi:acetyl-CoA synthetase
VAWLFCVPQIGVEPNDALGTAVRDTVVAELGKAFAPDQIRFVPALPKTRSAKIVRRAVRAAVLGEDPGDLSSLEDPDVLAQFGAER